MVCLFAKEIWMTTTIIQNLMPVCFRSVTTLRAIYFYKQTWNWWGQTGTSGPSNILLLHNPPPDMAAPFFPPFASSCPSVVIDLQLMPDHHRSRLPKESRWLDRILHLQTGSCHGAGKCHQETSGLMCWIYVLLSSFQCRPQLRRSWSLISNIWALT